MIIIRMITMIMITSASHWLSLQIHLEFNGYNDYDYYDDDDYDDDYEGLQLVALANPPKIPWLP